MEGHCRVWVFNYEKYLNIRQKIGEYHREELHQRVELLKTVSLFQSLKGEFDFTSISDVCTRLQFQKNQVIVREGTHVQYLYIVQKGECCAYRDSASHKHRTASFVSTSSSFSSAASVISAATSATSAATSATSATSTISTTASSSSSSSDVVDPIETIRHFRVSDYFGDHWIINNKPTDCAGKLL
ncbi:hypothetical protein RFI_37839, partial [Reticulomyxa filosa]